MYISIQKSLIVLLPLIQELGNRGDEQRVHGQHLAHVEVAIGSVVAVVGVATLAATVCSVCAGARATRCTKLIDSVATKNSATDRHADATKRFATAGALELQEKTENLKVSRKKRLVQSDVTLTS
jgi:hypothetical protein